MDKDKLKWIIKSYMCLNRINSWKELARLSGIKYTTLKEHLDNPGKLRLFELQILDELLKFDEQDLLELVRGAGT